MIERERRGDYLGKTVQVVPHITDAICDWIERVAKEPGVWEMLQKPLAYAHTFVLVFASHFTQRIYGFHTTSTSPQHIAPSPTVDGKDGQPDVCVIELGGTVGDIESMPFVEAMRQFQFRVGANNFCVIHVSLVPVLGVVGEQKTKPTQHSVAVLRSLGLHPNFLAVRSQEPLKDATRDKLVRRGCGAWGCGACVCGARMIIKGE